MFLCKTVRPFLFFPYFSLFFFACLNLRKTNCSHSTYLASELEIPYSVSYTLDSLTHKSRSPDSSDQSEAIFFFYAGVQNVK